MDNIQALKTKTTEIRIQILQMICSAKGGHIGGALSCVDILVALYHDVLRIDPQNPQWEERDRFILSKGHGVEGYYAVLADIRDSNDLSDIELFTSIWLDEVETGAAWNLYGGDDVPPWDWINFLDYAVFADNWLKSSYD